MTDFLWDHFPWESISISLCLPLSVGQLWWEERESLGRSFSLQRDQYSIVATTSTGPPSALCLPSCCLAVLSSALRRHFVGTLSSFLLSCCLAVLLSCRRYFVGNLSSFLLFAVFLPIHGVSVWLIAALCRRPRRHLHVCRTWKTKKYSMFHWWTM